MVWAYVVYDIKNKEESNPDEALYGWLIILFVSNTILLYFFRYKYSGTPFLGNTDFVYIIFGFMPNILLSAYAIQYAISAFVKKSDTLDILQKIGILFNLFLIIVFVSLYRVQA